jgi:hypothetical protein
MARKAACLTRNTFHQATISKERYSIESNICAHVHRPVHTIGVVVDEVEPLFIVNGS